MRKVVFYEKDNKLKGNSKAEKSPYFSLKLSYRGKRPFWELPLEGKIGREIFKEWKI